MHVKAGYKQMSGLAATYDQDLLQRVRADNRHVEANLTVTVRSLNEILGEVGIRQIDYISLDVEGAELGILESFDF